MNAWEIRFWLVIALAAIYDVGSHPDASRFFAGMAVLLLLVGWVQDVRESRRARR